MQFILPKKELIIKTSVSDPYDLYYVPFPPIRKILIDRVRVTLSMLERKKYKRVLEIGVGAGVSLPSLSTVSEEIYGVDVHDFLEKLEGMLQYYKIENKVVLKKSSTENLPFQSDNFDAIVGISVLEHLQDPEKAIKELTRVLKADGEAVFGFPKDNILTRMIFSILTCIGQHEKGEHKQHSNEIIEMLEKYFIVEKIKHLPALFPKSLGFYTMVKCRKK